MVHIALILRMLCNILNSYGLYLHIVQQETEFGDALLFRKDLVLYTNHFQN